MRYTPAVELFRLVYVMGTETPIIYGLGRY